MTNIIFEVMVGTYMKVVVFLLPNLEMFEDERQLIGVWG